LGSLGSAWEAPPHPNVALAPTKAVVLKARKSGQMPRGGREELLIIRAS
jgi:hypothetical protein